jgi:hypothetical protein
LDEFGLEPRALGRGDYPVDSPLREVVVIAKHCSGGLVLGFSQLSVERAQSKSGTPDERRVTGLRVPTPWNHLEAGILFALGLPLLVFREEDVAGGIFDLGASDAFVHQMPTVGGALDVEGLREVFLRWQARVRERYYNPP